MTVVASSEIDAAAPEPQSFVDQLLPKLRSDRITFFPIRHHSPACAAHVKLWIETHRPASVLIEGPESFTPFAELLADSRCRFPVAVYVNFVDHSGHIAERFKQQAAVLPQAEDSDDLSGSAGVSDEEFHVPPRFSAYKILDHLRPTAT